jgi:hypothetical protein
VESRRGVHFNAKKPIGVADELGDKLRSAIADDFMREAMFGVEVCDVPVCPSFRSKLGLSGDGNDLFTEPINDNQDCIMALRLRKRANVRFGEEGVRTEWIARTISVWRARRLTRRARIARFGSVAWPDY